MALIIRLVAMMLRGRLLPKMNLNRRFFTNLASPNNRRIEYGLRERHRLRNLH